MFLNIFDLMIRCCQIISESRSFLCGYLSEFFRVTFDILLIHLSYRTLSLFICDSLVAQNSQPHSSRFVTVAMNKRLRVGIPRDLLQRIFLASDSNILNADLILASMSVSSSSEFYLNDSV
jgi:hypothetical protein